jgi:putative oxidoreductase
LRAPDLLVRGDPMSLSAPMSKVAELGERAQGPTHAALRIVSGALFSFHGMQKILGVYAQTRPVFPAQTWFGGVIEIVGGTLIWLGLFTRCAAFICSGMMAVAYTQFHWKLEVAAGKWLPAINKGELAVIYCFVFLFLAAHGAGPFSLDARRGKAR